MLKVILSRKWKVSSLFMGVRNGKIFANYISNKGLASKVYMYNFYNLLEKIQFKSGQRIWIDIKKANKHMKKCSASLEN